MNIQKWYERSVDTSAKSAKFLLLLFGIPFLLLAILLGLLGGDDGFTPTPTFNPERIQEYETLTRNSLESRYLYYRVTNLQLNREDGNSFPIEGKAVLQSPVLSEYPVTFQFSITRDGDCILESIKADVPDFSYLSEKEIANIRRKVGDSR